jgi:transcriptional regulator with XRE-family HTH domain
MSLKKMREAKGLSQKALAERSGVHVVKIYQIEAGTIRAENMSLKNALRLAEALDCECRDLLEEGEQ